MRATENTRSLGLAGRVAAAVAVAVALSTPGATHAKILGMITPTPQAETGRITGTISSSAGGPIVEANVVARSAQTGLTRKTKSSKAGTYTIPNLKAGVYEVTVEAPSMDRAVLQVRVTVGSSSRLDFTLYPAQAANPAGD